MTYFKKKVPRAYQYKLKVLFGKPDFSGKYIMGWDKPLPYYVSIYIKDEYIPHSFPKPHHDFVYSVAKIKLTPQQRSELKELRCQNCDAPLPLPGEFDDAVVCAHCGTAHLL